jgi:hypothetical protein
MKDDTVQPTLLPGEYEHYKGGRYRVLGVGRHTETDEYYVVYVPLYEAEDRPDFWLRPYDMFTSAVEINGVQLPRFQYVDPADVPNQNDPA